MGLRGVVYYPLPAVLWVSELGTEVSGLVSRLISNHFLQSVSYMWAKGGPTHLAWPGLSGGGPDKHGLACRLLGTLTTGGT